MRPRSLTALSPRTVPPRIRAVTRPVPLDVGSASGLSKLFTTARRAVVEAGYLPEIAWQESVSFDFVTEPEFLREYAWVVLNCGMRESVVRKRFGELSLCFWRWESASLITTTAETCRRLALGIFNHGPKIDAILSVAQLIANVGFGSFRHGFGKNPLGALERLPYIGQVTKYHLAKNLGMEVAKPDRHLSRIATALGFQSPQDLCARISRETGVSIPVVDLVLWRFATLKRAYMTELKTAAGY